MPLKKKLLLWTLLGLGMFAEGASHAAILVADNFDDLNQWTILPLGSTCCKPKEDTTDPARAMLLQVDYSGNNEHIQITRTLGSSITQYPNLIFEIEFWDDPSQDYGTDFNVMDVQGNYVMFGVNNKWFPQEYFVGNGPTRLGTNRPRTYGWHLLQLVVTEKGTYLALDGQSLVYLRAKVVPENDQSFPINTSLKTPVTVSIEYPSWDRAASQGWWDNFRIKTFRASPGPGTLAMEEDLILDYLSRYETTVSSAVIASPSATLQGMQNYQLSRLALAAAYGVRAKRSGAATDWAMLETLLTKVVNDYPQWSQQYWEAPIAAQAVALVASWRWAQLPPSLQNNIRSLITQESVRTALEDANRPYAQIILGCYTTSDSCGEVSAWMASLLGFAANFLLDHPSRSSWEAQAKVLACNSQDRPSQLCSAGETIAALTDAYLFYNHGMVNPSYSLTIPLEFAQANLFELQNNQTIDSAYTYNLSQLYVSSINPLVRPATYTYRAYSSADKLLYYTARDDWGQDATLQDSGWAFLDRVLSTNRLPDIVHYAWLTRAGGTAYPSTVQTLLPWMQPVVGDCGDNATSDCPQYIENDSLYFFLNSMDAFDRFVTLFILGPAQYPLQTTGCGSGLCEAEESCASCPADCGACPPTCPNGSCEPEESCASCPDDCGTCPDGYLPPADGGPPSATDRGGIAQNEAGTSTAYDLGGKPGTDQRQTPGLGPSTLDGGCGCQVGVGGARAGSMFLILVLIGLRRRRKKS